MNILEFGEDFQYENVNKSVKDNIIKSYKEYDIMKAKEKYSKDQLKDLVDEHKNLVDVMSSKSKEDDKKELKDQKEELEGYEKDLKKAFEILEKGIGHKYFKREGTPGNYKYYYTEADYKAGKSSSSEPTDKEAFALKNEKNLKLVGSTKSGKNVYHKESGRTAQDSVNHYLHEDFSEEDHRDAAKLHDELYTQAKTAAEADVHYQFVREHNVKANELKRKRKETEKAFDILEKGAGEGSRGGKIIGHTKSGKAIYANFSRTEKNTKQTDTSNFTEEDLKEALKEHVDRSHREKYSDLSDEEISGHMNEASKIRKKIKDLKEKEVKKSEESVDVVSKAFEILEKGMNHNYKMGVIRRYEGKHEVVLGNKVEHASSFEDAKKKIDKYTEEKTKEQSTKKTEGASKVLKLMDEDYEYQDALKKVLSEDPELNKEALEKELDKYI